MTAIWTLVGLLAVALGILATALFSVISRMDTQRLELRGEILGLRIELKGEMAELRTALREDIRELGRRLAAQGG